MCAVPLPLAQSCVCMWEMANRPQLPVAPPVLLTCGSVEDLQEKRSGTSLCGFSTANWQMWFLLQPCNVRGWFYLSFNLLSFTPSVLLCYSPEGRHNWHSRLLLRPHRSMFLRTCQSQQTLINHNLFKINMVDCKWICWLFNLWWAQSIAGHV